MDLLQLGHLSLAALAAGWAATGAGGSAFGGGGGTDVVDFEKSGSGGMIEVVTGFGSIGLGGSGSLSMVGTGGILEGSGVGGCVTAGAGAGSCFFGVKPRSGIPVDAAGAGSVLGGSATGGWAVWAFRLRSQKGQCSQSPVKELLHLGHVVLGRSSSS
jgi:hypothetical protein